MYPSALSERPGNSNDDLWKLLVVEARHHTERQQFVDDRKSSVEKLRFNAVTKVICEHGILYLDSTQKCFDNEAVT